MKLEKQLQDIYLKSKTPFLSVVVFDYYKIIDDMLIINNNISEQEVRNDVLYCMYRKYDILRHYKKWKKK